MVGFDRESNPSRWIIATRLRSDTSIYRVSAKCSTRAISSFWTVPRWRYEPCCERVCRRAASSYNSLTTSGFRRAWFSLNTLGRYTLPHGLHGHAWTCVDRLRRSSKPQALTVSHCADRLVNIYDWRQTGWIRGGDSAED